MVLSSPLTSPPLLLPVLTTSPPRELLLPLLDPLSLPPLSLLLDPLPLLATLALTLLATATLVPST